MANQVGKRYRCAACGTEVLVTKPGDGSLLCCGEGMTLLQPKKTPSAD
jgi:desulfoferrodoxin-like iron-binding protein